jgi:hypothetical protein
MSYETYVNLLNVLERRKRSAAKTGNWTIVSELCKEIVELKAQYIKEFESFNVK